MFRPGETVCVSPNQFGYHSIPLEMAMSDTVTLVPTDAKWPIAQKPSIEMQLVALNPIRGFRQDNNCTAFRNFLIEMDVGPLPQQLAYIERLRMPYSAAIFSGGKSLHFLISLDRDLPDQKTWRLLSEWILGVCTAADQMTKNPSRSIRIPGPIRDKSRQVLARYKGAVTFSELRTWLELHPEQKPKPRIKKVASGTFDFNRLAPWVIKRLTEGLDPQKGRNGQWYAIAYEFALAGYSEDGTIEILNGYYSEDSDFKEKEWLTAISSAFNHVHSRVTK